MSLNNVNVKLTDEELKEMFDKCDGFQPKTDPKFCHRCHKNDLCAFYFQFMD